MNGRSSGSQALLFVASAGFGWSETRTSHATRDLLEPTTRAANMGGRRHKTAALPRPPLSGARSVRGASSGSSSGALTDPKRQQWSQGSRERPEEGTIGQNQFDPVGAGCRAALALRYLDYRSPLEFSEHADLRLLNHPRTHSSWAETQTCSR